MTVGEFREQMQLIEANQKLMSIVTELERLWLTEMLKHQPATKLM